MKKKTLSKYVGNDAGYDAAGLVYDRDDEGIDLHCAYCGKLLLPAYPPRADSRILKGATCPNCGGKNQALD